MKAASAVALTLLFASLATNHWPLVTVAALGACALVALAECVRRRRVPAELWLLLIPFGYWTLSFALSGAPWRVFVSPEFLRRDGAIFFSMAPLAIVAAMPGDAGCARRLTAGFVGFLAAVAAAGAVSALAGWTWAAWHPAAYVDNRPTFFAFYVAHNATASVYVLAALGAGAALLAPAAGTRDRWIAGIVGGLLVVGCVLARSRGAYLGLGAGGVLLLARHWRVLGAPARRAALAGGAVVLILGGVVLGPRFLEIARGQEGTHSVRLEYWPRAWRNFESSPVTGIGFGRYNDEPPVVRNDDKHAHNSYLHWMAEGGILGLGAMVVFWILLLRRLKPAGEPALDALREWIFAGAAALAVLSLTEHYAGGGIFLTFFSALIGLHRGASR